MIQAAMLLPVFSVKYKNWCDLFFFAQFLWAFFAWKTFIISCNIGGFVKRFFLAKYENSHDIFNFAHNYLIVGSFDFVVGSLDEKNSV